MFISTLNKSSCETQ